MSRIGTIDPSGSGGGGGDGEFLVPTARYYTDVDSSTQEGDLGNIVVHVGTEAHEHTLDHDLAAAYTIINGSDQPLTLTPTGGPTISGGESYVLPPRGLVRPSVTVVYVPDEADWVIQATTGIRADGTTIKDLTGELVADIFDLMRGALDSGTVGDAVGGDVVFGGTPSPDGGVTPGVPKMFLAGAIGGGGLYSDWTREAVAADPEFLSLGGFKYTMPGSSETDYTTVTTLTFGAIDPELGTITFGQSTTWDTVSSISTGELGDISGHSYISIASIGKEMAIYTDGHILGVPVHTSLSYAATVTTPSGVEIVDVAMLTGDITINPPDTERVWQGKKLRFRLSQDGGGGHAVTWEGTFLMGDNSTPDPTAAGESWEREFVYTGSFWRLTEIITGF